MKVQLNNLILSIILLIKFDNTTAGKIMIMNFSTVFIYLQILEFFPMWNTHREKLQTTSTTQVSTLLTPDKVASEGRYPIEDHFNTYLQSKTKD